MHHVPATRFRGGRILQSAWYWLAVAVVAPIGLAAVIAIVIFSFDRALLAHYLFWQWQNVKKQREPFGTSPMAEAAPVDLIITLVHGTWAPFADWTRADSVLRRRISDALADLRVAFHVLQWSGGNSVSARAGAARQLAADLRTLAEKHPTAAHVVVAHSHGGNAVMYALRDDPTMSERLTGIIFIATPFLHARMRDIAPFDHRFVQAMYGGLVAIPLGWCVHQYVVPEVQRDSVFGWSVTIAALVLGTLAGWMLARPVERYADICLQKLSLPSGKLPPILVIRAIADEASAVLSLVFAGGMISGMVWQKIARAASGFARRAHNVEAWIKRRKRAPLLLLLVAVGGSVLGFTFGAAGVGVVCLIAAVVLAVLALIMWVLPNFLQAVALVLAAVLLVPYAVFVSLLATSVSPGLALTGVYLEVIAEALPLGNHGVTLYDPKQARRRRTTIAERVDTLAHSRLYSDAGALADVASWIRTCMAA